MLLEFTLQNKNGTISFKIERELDEAEVMGIMQLSTTVLAGDDNEVEEEEVYEAEDGDGVIRPSKFRVPEIYQGSRTGNFYEEYPQYGNGYQQPQRPEEDIPAELLNIPEGKKARLKIVHINNDSSARVAVMKTLREHGVGSIMELKECINEKQVFPIMEAQKVAKIIIDLQKINCYAAIKYVEEATTIPQQETSLVTVRNIMS